MAVPAEVTTEASPEVCHPVVDSTFSVPDPMFDIEDAVVSVPFTFTVPDAFSKVHPPLLVSPESKVPESSRFSVPVD